MSKQKITKEALPKEVQEKIIDLGNRIKKARISRHISMEDMAKKVFVSPKTLRRLERGNASVSLSLLISVLFVLNREEELNKILEEDKITISYMEKFLPRKASQKF